MASDRKLFIIVNEDRFFLSHRKEIGVAAKNSGWDVTVVAKNTGVKDEIEKLGLKYVELPGSPTSKNLRKELRTLYFLYKLYGKEKDAIMHHVGLKNIVWGGVAARLRGVRGVVNAVSGLGIIFSEYKPSGLKKFLVPVLRWSMRGKNVTLIFQNHDDKKIFEEQKINNNNKLHMIKGSGVDLKQFSNPSKFDHTPKRIVFAGRMVKDKGVVDVIKAAEILREKYEGKVEFLLCGALSTNPYAVHEEELEKLCDGKYIRWLGHRKDMPEIFQSAHIMCFPSYYREGIPKAIIDASAAGLPIITCDSIGCKETVENGVNGFKVHPKSPEEIAEKLDALLSDSEMCRNMGKKSREIAETEYDVNNVVAKHLAIYKDSYENSVKK